MLTVNTSMGDSRSELAANIVMAPEMWKTYGDDHEVLFNSEGLQKICIVNAEGKVIGKESSVSSAIKSNLYTNATTLRHEDFLIIQDMITEVRRRSLNGIKDLMDAGLDFPVSLSDQLIGTEAITEFQAALQEMNPGGYQDNNSTYAEIFTPNPITHQSFTVPWRQAGFQYKTSAGLKETMRQVAERLEETLFNGNTAIKVSLGGTVHGIYGYTTHPDRGTATITDWSLTANNDTIVDEVIDALNGMFKDQGGTSTNSIILYYPKNFKGALDRDYVSGFPSVTVAERLKKIPEIKDVKYAEKLADSNVLFVEMLDRTVQLAVASGIISVPHVKTNPMQGQVITTYAAEVQIIKVDTNGNTGIVHASI